MYKFLSYLIATCLVMLIVALDGFVLTKLWQWFIVSTFGVNPLTLIQAIGISAVVKYLTQDNSWTYAQEKTHEQVFQILGYRFLNPWHIMSLDVFST